MKYFTFLDVKANYLQHYYFIYVLFIQMLCENYLVQNFSFNFILNLPNEEISIDSIINYQINFMKLEEC